jgi:hypothetical protein
MLSVSFSEAGLSTLSLAKIGNPLRGEPLLTSKKLCHFADEEADLLTTCFLKSFKSLEEHRLDGDRGPDSNPMHEYASSVFADPEQLLPAATEIAKHLYAKSHHPNIKSGDLCTSLIEGIIVGGEAVQGLCIIKSESKVPFLTIETEGDDLTLHTQEGIYPDKIDKGCLIVNTKSDEGFAVYLFDRSGNTHFWNRDFAGSVPVRDPDYMTKRFAEVCVDFASKGLPADTKEEKRMAVANKALTYLNEAEEFSVDEFEKSLEEPEMAEKFSAFKEHYEEETGNEIDDAFTVSKSEAKKAKRSLKGRLKLDTGAELRFSSAFIDQSDSLLERGFDADKGMNFLKVYFSEEVHS